MIFDETLWLGMFRPGPYNNQPANCYGGHPNASLYSWVDGSPTVFTNWYDNDPNCYNVNGIYEGCGCINFPLLGMWNDFLCNDFDHYRGLCKYSGITSRPFSDLTSTPRPTKKTTVKLTKTATLKPTVRYPKKTTSGPAIKTTLKPTATATLKAGNVLKAPYAQHKPRLHSRVFYEHQQGRVKHSLHRLRKYYWYQTCGVHTCDKNLTYFFEPKIPECSLEIANKPCNWQGRHCDPGLGCGISLTCLPRYAKPSCHKTTQ